MARPILRFLMASALVLIVALLVRRTAQLRYEAQRVVPSPDPWTPITEEPDRRHGDEAAAAADGVTKAKR